MKRFLARCDSRITSMVRTWWADHTAMLLRLAVVVMGIVALPWLGYQFWRLLWQSAPIWPTSPTGAVDLSNLCDVVCHWFAGRATYGELTYAVLPPASYVILWPLLGWLPMTPVLWLYAVSAVAALGWLAYLIVEESHADTPLERILVALMPFSMYAAGATIGNGQLIVHLLPMLLAGLLLLERWRGGWCRDLLSAALILAALVKPSVSIPFLWLVLILPGGIRTALFVSLGYVMLSLFAVSFQEQGALSLLREWLARGSGLAVRAGHADLHIWLAVLGLGEWILPASLFVLAALGFWSYRHRRRDLWLLMGVTAIVARFWTYHRWYDDLLILLPMVALFRIAKRGPCTSGDDVVAGVLLALSMLSTLAPGGLHLFPAPWNMMYVAGQTFVWIVVLIFLLDRAGREGDTILG